MEADQNREEFDTGLRKIRHEIKSLLVSQGFFGSITFADNVAVDDSVGGSTIRIVVNGRTAERSFSREEIEGCRLRAGGAVLAGIISMVEDLSKS